MVSTEMISLENYKAIDSVNYLKNRYSNLLIRMRERGAWLWGSERLGAYVENQLRKNGYKCLGYIDNDSRRYGKRVYSPTILQSDDIVIVTSIYYYDISIQLEQMKIFDYIYYEELALGFGEFEIYYQGFKGLFSEIERHKVDYIWVKERLADNSSREIFDLLLLYRMTLDVRYVYKAHELSEKTGKQDFDDIIVKTFNNKTVFFDVGACDGTTSEDFIKICPDYREINLFEPDKELLDMCKSKLKLYNNVSYIEAGVGKENGIAMFDNVGFSAGVVGTNGTVPVKMVKLDDYINSSYSYVKMDIEGSEFDAICGMKSTIEELKPSLAISVYHLPGDIHRLIRLVLDFNPNYKVYLRHYTDSYADSIAYFV